jgi:hypothetical protein
MFKIIIGIVLIVVLIAIGPLATIWAMNTLFPVLAIPYTVWTWLSVVILGAFMQAKVSVKK